MGAKKSLKKNEWVNVGKLSVKKGLTFLLTLFLFLVSCPKITGQTTLTNTTEDLFLDGTKVLILKDTSRQIKFEEIINRKFAIPDSIFLRNYDRQSVYWIKSQIINQASLNKKWVLEALTPNMEVLEIWIPDQEGKFTLHKAGLKNATDKTYRHKNYIFDLPSYPGSYFIFIRAYSPNDTGLEFKIRTQQFFTRYALSEYFFLGIYYGIFVIVLVYNLLLFINNRNEKVYLFYSLYVIACLLLSLSEDGLGVELFYKKYAGLNLYFYYYLFPSLFMVSSVLYARSFLNLKTNFKLADRFITWFTVIYLLYILVLAIRQETFTLPKFYIVPFVVIYLIAIHIFRKGYKPARFFILGYSIVFLSLIILQLRMSNFLESNIFTVYIFNYGILAEAVILSFSLGDRMRLIKKKQEKADKKLVEQLKKNNQLQQELYKELEEKHLLSEKVNQELEHKVSERTRELQQKTDELSMANHKLEKLSQQLTEMNVRLDIDNWELKKQVKEERKARIVSDEISFEEFIKTFPDQHTCLKYLEEIKWCNGYTCRKCNNIKYTEKGFIRKCTKCNYSESPTSHTLFHSLKIPLMKAFYIVYVVNSKQKITIDQLAELLEIGKNTCWDFRKKVLLRKEERRKVLKLSNNENWDVLISDDFHQKKPASP